MVKPEVGKIEKEKSVEELASMDSVIPNAGTPLTGQTRVPDLASTTADDHTSHRNDLSAQKEPDDIRLTMLTVPSIYSQDSAPSSATSSSELVDSPAESTSTAGKAGSGDASESTRGSGRRRPMSGVFTQMAVGWGRMKEEMEKRKSIDLGNSGHRVCVMFRYVFWTKSDKIYRDHLHFLAQR